MPFPSRGDLPNPGIKPTFSALAGRFFTTGAPGKVRLQVLRNSCILVMRITSRGHPTQLVQGEQTLPESYRFLRNICEKDTTERLHFSLSCIGEGNDNPLQCSCPENPQGQRSPVGYSPWHCKRVQHDLVTKQQQLGLLQDSGDIKY